MVELRERLASAESSRSARSHRSAISWSDSVKVSSNTEQNLSPVLLIDESDISYLTTNRLLQELNIESDRATNTNSAVIAIFTRLELMTKSLEQSSKKKIQMYNLILLDVSRLTNFENAFRVFDQIKELLEDFKKQDENNKQFNSPLFCIITMPEVKRRQGKAKLKAQGISVALEKPLGRGDILVCLR